MPNIDPITLNRLLRFKFKQRTESECVNDVEYNPLTKVMVITFQQRGTYQYKDVPLDVYVDFESSGSQGTYFNLYIRDHGYEYERIA